MENQTKVNLYLGEYAEEVAKSSLTSFNPNDEGVLRLANHQYEQVFDYLISSKTLEVSELDLLNKTLSQAVNDEERENVQSRKFTLILTEDYHIQNEKMEKLMSSGEDIFMTFGLMEYFDDNKMLIKSAPLVFVPVIIEKNSEGHYQIKNINHEIYINEPLSELLKESKRIDIDYPLDGTFSLVEYLTYVSTKVRNFHFSVNNGCFISPFDLRSYARLKDYKSLKDDIADSPIVKSISYLNSEFFNLNKTSSLRLSNHYLSLLNLDNEEYKILKRVNIRENLVLKTNSLTNRKHLLDNIIQDFLLNGKNVLMVYDDEKSYEEILSMVKESICAPFVLDMNVSSISKENLVSQLISKNRLEYDIKLIDQSRVDETADNYYLLKNNFKKIINSLRKSNDPMHLSINRAIFEYYSLGDIPLIGCQIPNAELMDDVKLKDYLDSVHTFMNSVSALKCYYKDHPFYGFNNISLNQEGYVGLKEKLTLLSDELVFASKIYYNLSEKYSFPYPDNLKEMKAILNIISLIKDLHSVKEEFFSIPDIDEILSEINHHNELTYSLNALRSKLISLYEENIFLIDNEGLSEDLSDKASRRKLIKKYSTFFNKSVRLDNAILSQVNKELSDYYHMDDEINSLYKKYDSFRDFYHEGVFQIEEIDKVFDKIEELRTSITYLNKAKKEYDYKTILNYSPEQMALLPDIQKKCQISFNHLLSYITYIQENYDPALYDFTGSSFEIISGKVNSAAKNFSSINQYLDFYLTTRKINKIIPSLGDELLKHYSSDEYIAMFMKRFYYDFINALIRNNAVFTNFDNDNFLLNITHYKEYDSQRKEIISAFIRNQIKTSLEADKVTLKSVEIPYLNSVSSSRMKAMPLKNIITQAKSSLMNMFPVNIISSKDISLLLSDTSYHYECAIVFPDENSSTREMLCASSRASQVIVMDKYLLNDTSDNVIPDNSELFLNAAIHSLNNVSYVSSSYKKNVLRGNTTDTSLKNALAEKLVKENFIVSKDIMTRDGTIDLLVRVPNSTRPTAVILDRLSYYSIESAIESIEESDAILEKMNFASYHIITALYFLNEEVEFRNLVAYIVSNAISDKSVKKVSRKRPLMEVLFRAYRKPEDIYMTIRDKNERPSQEVMVEFLSQAMPLTKDEVISVFGNDAISTLATMQSGKLIQIKNNFVFLNGVNVEFRRVDEENYSRDFNKISNEEISSGVMKILSQMSFSQDELIKLILSSLGYKKMNYAKYFRVQNIIGDLLEEGKLSIREDILYSSK